MRVFLAGASGVIGQRLIPRLVQAGHVVGGLTRSSNKTVALSNLGAEPILCDVFDRERLIRAVRDFNPDIILNELTDRERDVLKLRYGLTPDGCPHTLEEVGKHFRVTRERIRQIEAKAIKKLRCPAAATYLREYVD